MIRIILFLYACETHITVNHLCEYEEVALFYEICVLSRVLMKNEGIVKPLIVISAETVHS